MSIVMDNRVLCLTGDQFQWNRTRGELVFTRSWLASRQVASGPTLTAIGIQHPGQAIDLTCAAAERLVAVARTHPGCDALELRWSFPGAGELPRLTLTVRSDVGGRIAREAVDDVCSQLPRGYVTVVCDPPRPDEAGDFYVDLRRAEALAPPSYPSAEGPGYVWSLLDSGGDGGGWNQALEACLALRGVCVSVLIVPTRLRRHEAFLLDAYLTSLERIASEHDEVDLLRRLVRAPGDAGAARAVAAWREQRPGLDDPVLLRIGLRGDPQQVMAACTAVAAGIAADANGTSELMRPVPARSLEDRRWAVHSFDNLTIAPWHPREHWTAGVLPAELARLPFLHGANDGAHRLLLPVPTTTGCPGLTVADRHEVYRPAALSRPRAGEILLGHQLGGLGGGQAVGIHATNLMRSLLVAGAPGLGKTTAVQSILVRLWQEYQLPFLVLEPIRSEYRGLRRALGNDLTILTAGREDLSPLHLDPFTPLFGQRMDPHRTELYNAFAMGAALPSPLDSLLRQSIEHMYRSPGPYSMRRLVLAYEEVFKSYRYHGEALNLGSAMLVRLRALSGDGDIARILSGADTLVPVLNRPVVVELHELRDTEQVRFVSALVLQRVRAHARARRAREGLCHLTVLEEAHTILEAADRFAGSVETGQQQRRYAVEALCADLLTLRGFGEGFVIVTQQPSSLAEHARSAASNRLLFGLSRAEDRHAMAEDMGLDDALRALADRLPPGACIVQKDLYQQPVAISFARASDVDTSVAMPDSEL